MKISVDVEEIEIEVGETVGSVCELWLNLKCHNCNPNLFIYSTSRCILLR